ncbi:hypothetical protein ACWFQT_06520, partial [Cellulosimicrobium cellulans]
ILSFHRLRDRRASTVFGKWRTESRARLNGEAQLLAAVVPPRGYFPDFLTPSQEAAEPFGLDAESGSPRPCVALPAAGRRSPRAWRVPVRG